MKRFKTMSLLSMYALLSLQSVSVRADGEFYLKGGERVVFVGDSITQAGLYVVYVDAFLFTRFPAKRFTLLNRGISSETVAGTSEPNHPGPRPNLHDRLSRVVPPLKPDVVVACYGMNDGIYLSPNESVFAKYRDGIDRLIHRVRKETKAEIVLMTPPVYDVTRRPATNPDKIHSWKYPADDYDRALADFSAWLVTKRGQGFVVADVHALTADHLAQRRRDDPTFILSGDGLHPNPTGHWLIAQALLEVWSAPATCAEATIDAASTQVVAGAVEDLGLTDGTIHFTWTTPLPMPIDPKWDAQSITMARMNEKLNRYRLTVTNAPAKTYDLIADGKKIARLTSADLAAGVDLLRFPGFPTVEASRKVLKLVFRRRQTLYGAWAKSEPNPRVRAGAKGTQKEADKLESQIRSLCRPRRIALRLVPVSE